MSLSAGRLKHRVTLQSKGVPTHDVYGGEVVTWADVASVWAECLPLTGREYLASRAEVAETLIKVRIRWRADVCTTWRVVWDGRRYDIEAALDTGGLHQELVLMCKQVTA